MQTRPSPKRSLRARFRAPERGSRAELRFSKSAIAAFTAKLSEDKANEYKGLLSAHKKSKKALSDWLETRPKRNDENMAKFKKFNEDIASSMAKIESFE